MFDGVEKYVKVDDTVHIHKEYYHTIKAIFELTFIEVQCGNPLIEEDIKCFDWVWSEEVSIQNGHCKN